MRLTCPHCGDRDRREFYYVGNAVALNRPAADAEISDWDDYVHNRENPAGTIRDLWYHESGCSTWIVVTRNTITHEVLSCELASDVKQAMS
ncbi:MAG: sarcosine oxidase subunit delta [Roseovarius sp.]